MKLPTRSLKLEEIFLSSFIQVYPFIKSSFFQISQSWIFLAYLFNLILSFSVITACQKLPRLQFFDPLLKNLIMAPKEKILVDNDLKLNSASSLKKPNYYKEKN